MIKLIRRMLEIMFLWIACTWCNSNSFLEVSRHPTFPIFFDFIFIIFIVFLYFFVCLLLLLFLDICRNFCCIILLIVLYNLLRAHLIDLLYGWVAAQIKFGSNKRRFAFIRIKVLLDYPLFINIRIIFLTVALLTASMTVIIIQHPNYLLFVSMNFWSTI